MSGRFRIALQGIGRASMSMATPSRILKPGVYAPIPTFFQPDTEDLDLQSLKKHVLHVAQAGVGPLLAGSNGEGIHLTHEERQSLVKAAREVLDQNGLKDVPIIVGTGMGSTRETVQLCKEVASAGADYAIVITSGYFAGVLANNNSVLKEFFKEVAEKSPIPIIVYNYPGASGGIDLDSDLITELAEEPNVAGVKLTCGNVGKLTRIAATVSEASFAHAYPRKDPKTQFLVLGGYTDFILSSTYVNGNGAITGLANVAPYSVSHLYKLSIATLNDPSVLPEAQRVQGIIAKADFTIAKAGVSGAKALIQKLRGYGGLPRKPLPPFTVEQFKALWEHPHTRDLVKLEQSLEGRT